MNDTKEVYIYKPNQASMTMLIKFAEKRIENIKKSNNPDRLTDEEERFVILYDVYIKARSYAILNKTFLSISVTFAFAVLIWPSLSIFLHEKNYEWLKSAVVQTTITSIAALAFAIYSQYKNKQNYTESLMRYTLHSKEPIATLSVKVIEEIKKIDKGFSFANLTGKENINNDNL